MHQSAFDHMARCVEKYVPASGSLLVVDVGSRVPQTARKRENRLTHRELFERDGCEYIGVDIANGRNVDVVMKKPYRLPFASNSIDVVVTSQVFEHVPFVWVSMLEIARVLRPDGHAFAIAPSRGHVHGGQDCWRLYPDGMAALAAWSGLELREASTDFPPRLGQTHRLDYSAVAPTEYWGDTVAVFRKTRHYPRLRLAAVRPVMRLWANHLRGLHGRRHSR
jgi:SAM-dependent methyltransferase